MEIIKRTFLARKYRKNIQTRRALNKNIATSEYNPSYKYAVVSKTGETSFRTKRDAENWVASMKNRKPFLTTSQKKKQSPLKIKRIYPKKQP